MKSCASIVLLATVIVGFGPKECPAQSSPLTWVQYFEPIIPGKWLGWGGHEWAHGAA